MKKIALFYALSVVGFMTVFSAYAESPCDIERKTKSCDKPEAGEKWAEFKKDCCDPRLGQTALPEPCEKEFSSSNSPYLKPARVQLPDGTWAPDPASRSTVEAS